MGSVPPVGALGGLGRPSDGERPFIVTLCSLPWQSRAGAFVAHWCPGRTWSTFRVCAPFWATRTLTWRPPGLGDGWAVRTIPSVAPRPPLPRSLQLPVSPRVTAANLPLPAVGRGGSQRPSVVPARPWGGARGAPGAVLPRRLLACPSLRRRPRWKDSVRNRGGWWGVGKLLRGGWLGAGKSRH